MAWLPFSDRVEVNTCKLFLEDLNLQGSFPVFMQDLLRCCTDLKELVATETYILSVLPLIASLKKEELLISLLLDSGIPCQILWGKSGFLKPPSERAAHVYFLPTVGTTKRITLTKWRLIMIRLLHCLDCNAATAILIFVLSSTLHQNAL